MTSRAYQAILIANFTIPAEELAAYLAANERWEAFAHFWQALLPGSVYKVLHAVMQHQFFDTKTWQAGEAPFPSHERLAALAHLSERTVSRILARDAQKRYTYTYRDEVYHRVTEASIAAYEAERARLVEEEPDVKPWPPCAWVVGNLVAIKRAVAEALRLAHWYELGDLMTMFIRGVERRRYFDKQQQRSLRTTNAYHTAPFMPLPPTLACDLAYAQYLQKVQARRAELLAGAAETRAASAAPSAFKPPKCPPESSAKMTEEQLVAPQPQSSEDLTSIYPQGESPSLLADASGDDQPVAAVAISNGSADAPDRRPTRNEDEPGAGDHAIEPDRRPQLLAAHRAPPARPGVAPDEGAAARAARQALFDRQVQVNAVIGDSVQLVATLRGDPAPWSARRQLVQAFAAAQTPLERLPAALRLIEHRYDRVYGPGGKKVETTVIQTWLTVARSIIAKGRGIGYDFDAQDQREQRQQQVRQDTKAAAATGQLGYIQTPGYAARVGRASATPPPNPAPADAVSDAPTLRPDPAAEVRRSAHSRAGRVQTSRRATGDTRDDGPAHAQHPFRA